jgi:hypothetical protein
MKEQKKTIIIGSSGTMFDQLKANEFRVAGSNKANDYIIMFNQKI